MVCIYYVVFCTVLRVLIQLLSLSLFSCSFLHMLQIQHWLSSLFPTLRSLTFSTCIFHPSYLLSFLVYVVFWLFATFGVQFLVLQFSWLCLSNWFIYMFHFLFLLYPKLRITATAVMLEIIELHSQWDGHTLCSFDCGNSEQDAVRDGHPGKLDQTM